MNKPTLSSKLAAGLVLALIAGAAHATLWSIDEVLAGTDGGFGFSGFHDASTGSVMSGDDLGSITGSGAGIGQYNDVTGEFSLTTTSDGGLTTFSGVLDFGGVFGYLANPSSLDVVFGAPGGLLMDTAITFEAGDVCCGGSGNGIPGDDPNSFASTGINEAIITLWGANGWNGGYNNVDGSTTLGMDLRVRLTQVPEPNTAFLLGIGLLGSHSSVVGRFSPRRTPQPNGLQLGQLGGEGYTAATLRR